MLCIWGECGCSETLFYSNFWGTVLFSTFSTQVTAKCSIQWYFICGNNLYTFIKGGPVKWYKVDKIIVEKLIQSLISWTVKKYCKCLSKYLSCCILLVLPAVCAMPYSHPSSSIFSCLNSSFIEIKLSKSFLVKFNGWYVYPNWCRRRCLMSSELILTNYNLCGCFMVIDGWQQYLVSLCSSIYPLYQFNVNENNCETSCVDTSLKIWLCLPWYHITVYTCCHKCCQQWSHSQRSSNIMVHCASSLVSVMIFYGSDSLLQRSHIIMS